MAEELAVAYLSLVPSLKGASAAISKDLGGADVQAASRQAGRKIGDEVGKGISEQAKKSVDLKGLSAEIGQVSLALVAGGAAGAAGLYKLASAASDLEESQNKANVVLGKEGAAALDAYAAKATETAGLSKRAATEFGANFAQFGKAANLGGADLANFSIQLTQLAGDLASFSNTTAEEAATAISAGLRGESEPLRQYGVLLDEATLKARAMALGIADGTGPLTQQQRVLAAQAEILAQTVDAQDDYIRTADSLANQQRSLANEFENLQAQLGENLLPVFKTIVGGATSLLDVFSAMPGPVQAVATGLGTVGTAAALVFGGGGLLVSGGLRALDSWRELRARVGDTAPFQRLSGALRTSEGDLTRWGKAAKGAAIAGAALGVGFTLDQLGKGDAKEGFDDLAAAAENDTARIITALQSAGQSQKGLLDKLSPDFSEDWIRAGDTVVGTVEDIDRALGDAYKANNLDGLSKGLNALRTAAADPINAPIRDDLNRVIDDYARKLDVSDEAQKKTASSADKMGNAQAGAARDSLTLANSQARLQSRLKLSTAQMDLARVKADAFGNALDRASSFDNLLGSAVELGQGIRDFRTGLRPTESSLDSTTDSTDELAESQQRLTDAVSATDPALSALQINLDAVSAGADAFQRSLASGFQTSILGSVLDLGDAFDDFRDTVGQLPHDIDLAGASLDRYGELQDEGLRNVLKLGDATRTYLTNLLKQGQGTAKVRDESARLREAYAAQLRAMGLNSDQVERYLDLIGVTPTQVETAIRLSQIEESRFKLNAYINLLEGRIPESVATDVIAQVNRGDLDGASNTLARFAATNPVRIDTKVAVNEESLEQAVDSIEFRLPQSIDITKALTGQLDDQTLAGLAKAQELAKGVANYLQQMVEAGAGQPAVLAQADQLRAALAQVFTEAGAGQEAIQQIFEGAGLTDRQITLAFETAGFEESVAKIELLNSLLDEDSKPTKSVQRQISVAIAKGDLAAASTLLSAWVEDSQDGLIQNPLLVELAKPDVSEADSGLATWKQQNGEQVILLPFGADMAEATRTKDTWKYLTGQEPPTNLKLDADTRQATTTTDTWRYLTGQAPATPTKVSADTKPAQDDVGAFKTAAQAAPPILIPAKLNIDGSWRSVIGAITGNGVTFTPGFGGNDGNPLTPFAHGGLAAASMRGLVPGPRGQGDVVPSLLEPTEFVLTGATTAREGVAALNALNAGLATVVSVKDKRVRRFAWGGPVDPSASRAVTTAVSAAQSAPVYPAAASGDQVQIDAINNYGEAFDPMELPRALRRDRFLRGPRSQPREVRG